VEEIEKYADNLVASSNALLGFLNEILEVIKVASGAIPLFKKKFSLKEKLLDIVKLNQSKANQKKLELTFEYDESIPHYLIGDTIRIHRIVLELVTNALNFTAQGHVKISAKLAKQRKRDVIIKITIQDTGTGIALDKQQEIFTRFKRLTPSYEGIYKGTGLGLSVVKQFIDEIEGEIYLESEMQKGSIFCCVIPLQKALLDDELGVDHSIIEITKPEFSLPRTTLAVVNAQKQDTELTHVLVVEDLAIAAKVACSLLLNLGCTVDIAENGQSAINLVKNNHYDLIFMDVGLPDVSGNDVTSQIRKWETLSNTKRTPIIALTAHIDVENKEQCVKAGMDAVLSKPLTKEMASGILNAFIPRRATLQQQLKTEKELQKDEEQILFVLPEATIDFDDAVRMNGSEDAAKELLVMLVDSLPQELAALQAVYKQQDWKSIQDITHKLKSGACYCGTHRLQVACTNLEKHLKDNKTELRDKLYEQLLQEISSVRRVFAMLRKP